LFSLCCSTPGRTPRADMAGRSRVWGAGVSGGRPVEAPLSLSIRMEELERNGSAAQRSQADGGGEGDLKSFEFLVGPTGRRSPKLVWACRWCGALRHFSPVYLLYGGPWRTRSGLGGPVLIGQAGWALGQRFRPDYFFSAWLGPW